MICDVLLQCTCKPCLVGIANCINRLYQDSISAPVNALNTKEKANETQPMLVSAPAYYSSV
jgi:hypothetical protein